MISIITTLRNRADLLLDCLTALCLQTYVRDSGEIELIIIDGGSTDSLDTLLDVSSEWTGIRRVRKYTVDRAKSIYNCPFNCPAEEYNIAVKLAKYPYIFKTDPEMVLLDREFIDKALTKLECGPAIVMPFPYHCYEFKYYNLEDIENNYKRYYRPTHITRENAKQQLVYYQALFTRTDYLNLGGVDERFISGIGSEDNHFLDQWRRKYGRDSVIPFVDSPSVHLYHGDWGLYGVPQQFIPWVQKNELLRKQLENTYPNEGRRWGRIYDHITCNEWIGGKKTMEDKPLHEVIY